MSTTDAREGERLPDGTVTTGDSRILGRLARFVVTHRRRVMVGWLVLFIAGIAAANSVSSRLSIDFSLPGQPGYVTAQHINALYGPSTDEGITSVLVARAPAGQKAADHATQVNAAFAKVTAAIPGSRLADYASTHDPRFLGTDGRTTVGLLVSPEPTSFSAAAPGNDVRDAIQQALPGWTAGVTGLNQLASGADSNGPGVLFETLIGAAGALVVLAFVFASLLALVPLLIAAVSILTTLLLILLLTTFTDVSFIVQFLVALVGLGVGIDYSLLLVTRWREERQAGRSNADAVVRAVETAGHTVAVSGLTVAIGLLSLIVLPVPSLRSVGIGGVLIPLVSIVVVITLLPAVLGGIGPRVDWPRRAQRRSAVSRAWSGWARLIVRQRWAGAIGALVLLGLFAAPIAHLKIGETSVEALTKTGSAHDAYVSMTSQGISPGFITPIEVLASTGSAGRALSATRGAHGIATATEVTNGRWQGKGYVDVLAIPTVVTVNSDTFAPLKAVKAATDPIPGVQGYTGIGAGEQDFSRAVYGTFPLMLALIALATLILLARAFRSLLLAIKAVVLNLISLGATYGLLTWFWQEGHGSSALFGISPTGAITIWIPLMVFAFLFGLSMDYEVFILSRVREEYDDAGGRLDSSGAVVEGLSRTGRLVTSAALILFLAFASLASAPDTDLKVLATGLGVGILLDATVIRALLVPALMALFGRWNWWLPRPVARVLRVQADPL
jgi:putative drug exporter of the RND superfamily